MKKNEIKKLNLGSHNKRKEGWISVDILEGVDVDFIWDLTNIPYPKELEDADEIMAVEVLEHISFREVETVLKEWLRILKPGGKVHIQVPDIGKMCEYYVKELICNCVPHKAQSWDGYKADPECWNCRGKAVINPQRWLFAFTGAQKHQFDTHKNIFTRDMLEKVLLKVGFRDIRFKDNIYKLIVDCRK